MRLPARPPSERIFNLPDTKGMQRAFEDPAMQKLVRKAIHEYTSWDRMRYWSVPGGFEPRHVWLLREISSFGKRRVLPLADNSNRPFAYWLPDPAMEWLHRVDRRAPELLIQEDLWPGESERRELVLDSLMEESIASSQVEGAATTRRVAKEMLRTGRKPRDRSERMILNNYLAIERIRKMKDEPLSVDLMHELHRVLTDRAMDEPEAVGRFRTSPHDDDVKVYSSDQTVLHEPPLGREIPERVSRMIEFANAEDVKGDFIHPVVKAILLHFWVGYDHPYVDGNGRLGRALFYWYLLRRGYWVFEYLSISRIVLRTTRQYERAYLYSEIENNDATYFLMYNLRTIDAALEELRRVISRRQAEEKNSVDLLRRVPGINRRQRELLADVLRHPGRRYTIRGHQRTHGVVYQTARTDLQDLAARGLLEILLEGRTQIYVAAAGLGKLTRK